MDVEQRRAARKTERGRQGRCARRMRVGWDSVTGPIRERWGVAAFSLRVTFARPSPSFEVSFTVSLRREYNNRLRRGAVLACRVVRCSDFRRAKERHGPIRRGSERERERG
ncbi:hypothetical protein ALC62_05842 [Cyphomyrmex costatus]|uniref:Uncharacterized protein n=1 Tax=Cyphomyrmex costatus TaxID=456900 RepID=A0A151IJC7_9HYME|nr:hypothetical protein ALC62_05842 [Cyphomyrmex costatus]